MPLRIHWPLLIAWIVSGCASTPAGSDYAGSYENHVIVDEPWRNLVLAEDGRYQLRISPSMAVNSSGQPLDWVEEGSWRVSGYKIVLVNQKGEGKRVSVKADRTGRILMLGGIEFHPIRPPNKSPEATPGQRPPAAPSPSAGAPQR